MLARVSQNITNFNLEEVVFSSCHKHETWEKLLSPHEESNLRPSDSVLRCFFPLSHRDSTVRDVYYEVWHLLKKSQRLKFHYKNLWILKTSQINHRIDCAKAVIDQSMMMTSMTSMMTQVLHTYICILYLYLISVSYILYLIVSLLFTVWKNVI